MFLQTMRGIRFIHRGDVGACDFTVGNFICDAAWHDLDLSSICPKNTKMVLLGIFLNASELGRRAKFRTKGYVNEINIVTVVTQTAYNDYPQDFWVVPDINCKIQYWLSNVTWTDIDLVVRGWITG